MNALAQEINLRTHELPRSLAAIVALLGIGWSLLFAISREVPVGHIQGRVVIDGRNVPIARANIMLVERGRQRGYRVRRAVSNEAGMFSLAGVPAGDYLLSASSRAHQVSDVKVSVEEGQIAPVTLSLTRSNPALSLNQHQKVFGTNETPTISVSGYVDGKKPAHTDSLQLRIYKTRLSHLLQDEEAAYALEAVGRNYETAKRLPRSIMQPKNGLAPRKYRENEVRITEDDREGFFYQKIRLDRMPTGLYLMEIAHAQDTITAWALVTDTALILKKAGEQTLVFAVHMRTGQPLAGTEIRAYRNGRLIQTSRTDMRGLSEFNLPNKRATNRSASAGDAEEENGGEEGPRKTIFMAVRGDDEAGLTKYAYSSEENGRFVVHTYTDRPIYRPGQRVHFKGIVRQRKDNAPNAPDTWMRYDIPENEPVDVEMRDPGGNKILAQRARTNRFGSFAGSAELFQEAATGVYTIITKVRGQRHTHDFVLASYQKPEFEVSVTPSKPHYVRGEPMEFAVSGQFFFGAPVVGAEVTYYVYRSPSWAAERPADYEPEDNEDPMPSYFRRDRNDYYGQTVTKGKVTLDDAGKATIQVTDERKPDPDAPQANEYTISVSVKDPGSDRETYKDGKALVYAGNMRLNVSAEGYVAAPGQPSRVTIMTTDLAGAPLPNVRVQLEQIFYRWQKDEYLYESAGEQEIVTGPEGKATLSITPTKAGNLLLKARARDSANREILARADLWVVTDQGGMLDTEYTDLALFTDKRRYAPGETARVLINTESIGQQVLLTIEGERIHQAQLIPITKRSTVVRVPVRADYGPNVFLAACYVRQKKYAQSQAALRVEVPERALKVAIAPSPPAPGAGTAPAHYRPGDTVTYSITTTDAQGNPVPCEFSLGVVDESIYALREDFPAALRDSFYPRVYNRVSTEYSFAVEYLGDADKAEPKMTTRKNFPDTALWEPMAQTDAQGRATISLALPDTLTTWRATIRAHSRDTRLGWATNKIVSSKDFFVRVEKPRFLTQFDTSAIKALVHNATGRSQQVVVRLRAENLAVEGEQTRTLVVESGKFAEVIWSVRAETTAEAKLRVTSWTLPEGREQYTDGVETALPVRVHGREEFASFAGQLQNTGVETEIFRLDPKAVPENTRLTVRITPSLFSAIAGATDYLVQYPYGCAEQTTSRFLGNLYVQRLMRQKGIRAVPGAQRIPRYVREGLLRLYRMQNQETGGWGWFEQDKDDAWITAYALVGLITAQQEGYPVSKNALARGREAASHLVKTAEAQDRPFLLYALALTGDLQTARAERRRLTLNVLGTESLAHTVLLDTLLGNRSPALPLLEQKAQTKEYGLFWEDRPAYPYNKLLSTATALRALIAQNPNDSRISRVLAWLMQNRTGEYWMSTRDTAATLAALSDVLATQPSYAPEGQIVLRLNGQTYQTLTLTPEMQNQQELVLKIPSARLRPEKNELTLERIGGNSPVFYSVHLRQTVATDTLPARALPKYALTREYRRVVMQKSDDSSRLQTEATNNRLKVGDYIRVRLVITAPEELEHVLIEDSFPAGCTVTERGTSDEVVEWGYWWSSIDVRDDRIAFFVRRLSAGKHVIEYNLRAQTPGDYRALPTLAQPMYAPATQLETEAARLRIDP
jgi:uncharacterized protein YfaS (alpha-2-macroglobulin family)